MRKTFLPLSAILLSTLLFLAGLGLLGVILPVEARREGFSDLVIGVIGSAYYVGFVAGCFIGPRLVARAGHRSGFAVAASLAGLAILVFPMAVNQAAWIAMRALFGFAASILYMVLESWLNARATNATRGRVFSAYMALNYVGLIGGQAAFGLAHMPAFALFSLSAMGFGLCLIPVGLTRLPQPGPAPAPMLRPWRLFRIAPVGVAGCIAVGFANAAVWALGPVYAADHGLGKPLIAAFMGMFTLGGALVQMPLGRLSDHVDRRAVIAGVGVLACAAGLAMGLYRGSSSAMTLALIGAFGLLSLPLYGLSIAHANDHVPRERCVETSATLILINAVASIIGPTLAAEVIGGFGTGTHALFFYTAGVHGLLVLFVLARLMLGRAPQPGSSSAGAS